MPLTANFTATPVSPQVGASVTFSDASTGTPNSWLWRFGDGGLSTATNPTYTYTKFGTYTVSLTVADAAGNIDTTTRTLYVKVTDKIAGFSVSDAAPPVGTPVTFTDASDPTPVSWLWNFGDGGSATAQNPSYTYAEPGDYTVTLEATYTAGGGFTTSQTQVVSVQGPLNPINPAPAAPTATWNYSAQGIRYRFLLKYKEMFVRDGNSVFAWIETDWDTTAFLKDDLIGYSTWDGTAVRLKRQVPLSVPWSGPNGKNKQYLQRMDSDLFYPDLPDKDHIFPDPTNDNWPGVEGRIQYQLQFAAVPWIVKEDSEVSDTDADNSPPEQQRYVRVTRRYLPEARKIPTAGFEVYDPANPTNAPIIVQEVGSVPGFQVEIVAETIQWPQEAFPSNAVIDCLGRVNDRIVLLNDYQYQAGQLLYKGPAAEITPYDDASGRKSIDVPHLFGFRPLPLTGTFNYPSGIAATPTDGPVGGKDYGAWNNHRLNSGEYRPIVVKGTGPTGDGTKRPQFLYANLNRLFKPGG